MCRAQDSHHFRDTNGCAIGESQSQWKRPQDGEATALTLLAISAVPLAEQVMPAMVVSGLRLNSRTYNPPTD
jgi:hypothetical protein